MRLILTLCIGILILSLTLFAQFALDNDDIHHKELCTVITLNDNGYGYQIFYGEKELIRQESVPVLKGKSGFGSKEDAEKVALLVLNKLQRKVPPNVTLKELEQLGISLETHN